MWEVPGCYALELEPWSPAADSAAAAPPRSLMLVADPLDEWGRRQETFRAEPLANTPGGTSPVRWFVRADTLWLVWTRVGARGGVALRLADGGFVGRARVRDPTAGLDVTARAEALKINCATGRAEPGSAGRR